METSWLKSTKHIEKNLYVIGLAWIFLFTAFQCMANLQSSLNSDEGLGTMSLSTIYVSLVASSTLLPPLLIERFGLKLTIIMSQFMYLLYIAANVVPTWYTLLPAAVLVGIGAGPLWTAKCTYLTEIASYYAAISGETSEIVINRFFGIFFAMFQMSQILGNMISSTVLQPPETDDGKEVLKPQNTKCGFYDCPANYIVDTANANDDANQIIRPKTSSIYLLITINVILPLISIAFVAMFLDPFKRNGSDSLIKSKDDAPSSTWERKGSIDLLKSTLRQLKNRNQLLIIPLTLWLGFSLAFIGADFTKSFVACSKGVEHIGFAMICFGISNVIGSYFFGRLVKYTGRIKCFMIAAILNYMTIYLMIKHNMDSDKQFLLFLIPFIWGIADSAWQTQINSIYGVLFNSNQEAAFSNFRLWESVGFAISYAYSNSLCTSTKLYLLVFYLTVGMIGYLLIEYLENNRQFNPIEYIWNNRYYFALMFFVKLTVFYLIMHVF